MKKIKPAGTAGLSDLAKLHAIYGNASVDRQAIWRRRIDTARQAANGNWPAILASIGISGDDLTNRHSPCPGCGGSDRFRWDDRDGDGTFICGRGGDPLAGDGFALIMHVRDCTFAEALEIVEQALGITDHAVTITPKPRDPEAERRQAEEAQRQREQRQERFRRWLRNGANIEAGDVVDRYLIGRGIRLPAYPFVLRLADSFGYWLDKETRLAQLPAMLAAVQAPDGTLAGVHVTYLTAEGSKAELTDPTTAKPLDPRKLRAVAPGATRGGAVRLHKHAERLVIAEGIETALAAHLLTELPAWACLSTSGMRSLELPPEVRDVTIAADHDASGAGEDAAHTLARRLIAEGRTVRIELPAQAGTDWADVLRQEATA